MSESKNIMEKGHLEIGSQMVEQNLITFDEMYLDLALVRDFFLGAIYSLIAERPKDEALKNIAYVKANLKPYQMRLYHSVEQIFPELGFTNKQVKDRLRDKTKSNLIFRLSPTTEYVGILKYLILVNMNNSKLVEKYNKVSMGKGYYVKDSHPITFHLNTYPLEITDPSLLGLIVGFFTENYQVNVKPFCKDLAEIEGPLIGKIEEFHVYDLDAFLRNDCVKLNLEMGGEDSSDILKNLNILFKKRFFAPMIFDGERDSNIDREHAVEHIKMIHATLDVLSRKFDWIPNAHIAVDVSLFKSDLPPDAKPLKIEKKNVKRSHARVRTRR